MPGSHVCPRPRATFPAAEVRVHRQWLQGRSSEPEPWVPAAWERQQPRGPGLPLGTVCPRSVGLVRTAAPQQGILRWLGRAGRRVGVGTSQALLSVLRLSLHSGPLGHVQLLGRHRRDPLVSVWDATLSRPPGPSSHAPLGHAGLSPLSLSEGFLLGCPAQVGPRSAQGTAPSPGLAVSPVLPSCVPVKVSVLCQQHKRVRPEGVVALTVIPRP